MKDSDWLILSELYKNPNMTMSAALSRSSTRDKSVSSSHPCVTEMAHR